MGTMQVVKLKIAVVRLNQNLRKGEILNLKMALQAVGKDEAQKTPEILKILKIGIPTAEIIKITTEITTKITIVTEITRIEITKDQAQALVAIITDHHPGITIVAVVVTTKSLTKETKKDTEAIVTENQLRQVPVPVIIEIINTTNQKKQKKPSKNWLKLKLKLRKHPSKDLNQINFLDLTCLHPKLLSK